MLPLAAPQKVKYFRVRFRFQIISSKYFRFHKNLTASCFRFHIPVLNALVLETRISSSSPNLRGMGYHVELSVTTQRYTKL